VVISHAIPWFLDNHGLNKLPFWDFWVIPPSPFHFLTHFLLLSPEIQHETRKSAELGCLI
jgi:hypothetical protein